MTDARKPSLPPLFRSVLSQDWEALPAPVRNMHDFEHRRVSTGFASIERGPGFAASLIARLFGFPEAGASVPVQVTFERDGGGEIWTRCFAGSTFKTRLEKLHGTDHGDQVVVESFGPLSFSLQLHLDRGRLYLKPIAWRLFGLPLPMAFAPHGTSYEFAECGRFAFHIEICIPLAGLVVRYRGFLDPVSD